MIGAWPRGKLSQPALRIAERLPSPWAPSSAMMAYACVTYGSFFSTFGTPITSFFPSPSVVLRLDRNAGQLELAVKRTAVIDMGSNSFRLVVYGYEPGHHWKRVDEIREAVRVSAGMGESGAIKKSRVKRAVQTAAVFSAFCRHSGIEDVRPVVGRDARALVGNLEPDASVLAAGLGGDRLAPGRMPYRIP